MPVYVKGPARVAAAGNREKVIEEYIGRLASGTVAVSIARMNSPEGWREEGQRPEFDEYTIVLRGRLRLESAEGIMDVSEGAAVIARRGEWVRYSTPFKGGAEYISVCTPAFSLETVRRDNEDGRQIAADVL